MSLRIERHEVSDEALTEATENFNARIAQQVDAQQHFGRSGSGWDEAASMLSAYAGARSVHAPHAEADIRTALYSAAEAQIGALLLDGLPSSAEVDIDLTYTRTGICYENHDGEDGEGETQPETAHTVSPLDWTSAFYLSVVSGQTEDHRESLVGFARDLGEEHVLPRALASYLYPEMGLGRNESEAYVRSALERARARSEHESSLLTPVQRQVESDLGLLHALLSGDRDTFWHHMRERLEGYPDDGVRRVVPVLALLPTPELAFAALAVRVEGWEMPFETDYLPRYLVEDPAKPRTGRVGAYGADKDADAVRAVAGGRFVVERPEPDPDVMPGLKDPAEKRFDLVDERLAKITDMPHLGARLLSWGAQREILGFRFHSVADPQARDVRQLAALTHASQYSTAKFACVSSARETVEVAIGGTTVALQAFDTDEDTSETDLLHAVEEALLSGSRARLEALLDLPEGLFRREDENGAGFHHCYRRAFLAYLREERARGWTSERGDDDAVRAELDAALGSLPARIAPDALPFSGVLLSQLVADDEEGFNLALADRLEAQRGVFSVGHRQRNPDGLVDTHVLALACLARAKGWDVRVESDYLPDGVLERADAMFR